MGTWSVRSGSVACESCSVCVSRYTVLCCIVSVYCGPIQCDVSQWRDTSAFGIHPFDAVSGPDTSDTAALACSHGRISIHLFRYTIHSDTQRYTAIHDTAIQRDTSYLMYRHISGPLRRSWQASMIARSPTALIAILGDCDHSPYVVFICEAAELQVLPLLPLQNRR